MGQERLPHLALLSIENKLARPVDYTSIINDFAKKEGKKGEAALIAYLWSFTVSVQLHDYLYRIV